MDERCSFWMYDKDVYHMEYCIPVHVYVSWMDRWMRVFYVVGIKEILCNMILCKERMHFCHAAQAVETYRNGERLVVVE